ncbi:MAG: hypothetical protein KF874_06830 [Rhizobiaceae bacterium]|nr:hypothetical protein [Rhizobiaceae bacterium]
MKAVYLAASLSVILALSAVGNSAAQETDKSGCYRAPSNCVQATINWLENGRVMSMRMKNTCSSRLYIRFCNKRADGSDDCGADALPPGRTKVWNTQNADSRGIGGYRYIGSARNGGDWTCAGRDKSWNDPVY